jgi:hypothetical protein
MTPGTDHFSAPTVFIRQLLLTLLLEEDMYVTVRRTLPYKTDVKEFGKFIYYHLTIKRMTSDFSHKSILYKLSHLYKPMYKECIQYL